MYIATSLYYNYYNLNNKSEDEVRVAFEKLLELFENTEFKVHIQGV